MLSEIQIADIFLIFLAGAVGAFIVSVGTFIMQWRANKKMNEMREGGARRGEQISAVHDLLAAQAPPAKDDHGQSTVGDNSGR